MSANSGGFINPASLWGKPLPTTRKGAAAPQPKKKDTRMLPEDEDFDSEIDLEAVEDTIEPSDDELLDDVDSELADKEAETETVEVEASADGDDDDEDDDDEAEDDEEAAEASSDDDDVTSELEDDETDEEVETRRVNPVAEKKKKSMSDYVRDEIARRQETGESLRGVDIMTALSKRGVKVSAAQVSQLLKKAGISVKARGPKKSKLAAAAPAATEAAEEDRSRMAMSTHKRRDAKKTKAPSTTKVGGGELPVAQLRAAKAFLDACDGCYTEAGRVLELHEQLHDVL